VANLSLTDFLLQNQTESLHDFPCAGRGTPVRVWQIQYPIATSPYEAET
jgi:hypothetical protein